jgi:hypothetical protein
VRLLWFTSVLFLAGSARAGEGFTELRREADGLVIESRAVAGTGFPQFRIRVHVPAVAQRLADAVWQFRAQSVEGRMIERREILEEHENERLVWQVVRPPLVSRRESLIRFSRACDPLGAITIEFHSVPGPARVADTVRIAARGRWVFTPDPNGGTWLEHLVISDPGGSVPPFLAIGSQQDIAVALVREAIERTR